MPCHPASVGHDRAAWQAITVEDIHQRNRHNLSASLSHFDDRERLKEVLEDVADNLFNPDPYYQQGGDMVRCGGLGYAIDVSKPIGQRASRQ